MTDQIRNLIPDGLASAPGLALESDPASGFYKKSAGVLGLAIAGVEAAAFDASGVQRGLYLAEVSFVAADAGTYTGTIALPANSRILDIGVDGQALWDNETSASMIVGDDDDPDGFFLETDLTATDLLAGEINNLEHPGGLAGVYIASEQRVLFSAAARNVIGVITAVGDGDAGRTRLYVVYAVVSPLAAVQS